MAKRLKQKKIVGRKSAPTATAGKAATIIRKSRMTLAQCKARQTTLNQSLSQISDELSKLPKSYLSQPQYNRGVELNRKLTAMQKELERLFELERAYVIVKHARAGSLIE